MSCISEIASGIAKDCATRPAQGTSQALYGNLDDIDTVTYSADGGVVTGITRKTGKQMYAFESTDNGNSVAHTFSRDEYGVAYTHTSRHTVLDNTETITDMKVTLGDARVFTVVQRIFEGSDNTGKYAVAGIKNGMKLSVDTLDTNANNGTNLLEFATQAGEEEALGLANLWNTDETTTDAIITALLTIAL